LVGLVEMQFRLEGVHSLKDKRSVVQPVLHKLRNTFNCAAIESDLLDSHQMMVITAVTLNSSGAQLDMTINKMVETAQRLAPYEMTISRREVWE
jgi:uncharacterized protein